MDRQYYMNVQKTFGSHYSSSCDLQELTRKAKEHIACADVWSVRVFAVTKVDGSYSPNKGFLFDVLDYRVNHNMPWKECG